MDRRDGDVGASSSHVPGGVEEVLADLSSSTSSEIHEMLSTHAESASIDEGSSVPEEAGGADVPIWASIRDGNPQQTIYGEEVDFQAHPEWFLCQNHKLANIPWVKGETTPCGPDRAEVMRNARLVVDWRRQRPNEKVQKAFLDLTSDVVKEYYT